MMVRMIKLMVRMIKLMVMLYLLVMISTVETTHIGARRPGPDTEVGICNEALQKHMNVFDFNE